MNFSSKEYLPDSEKRIDHLRKIIDGRSVAILAAGPSIYELEKRIGELRHRDICYFGLNNYTVQENPILGQIDRHFSVIMFSGREGMPNAMGDNIDFLNRDEDNMFVSSFWRDTFGLMDSDFDLNQFLSKYDRKLIFFSLSYERTVPNREYPLHFIVSNSLLVFIQMAIIGKASSIILFGADGGCVKGAEEWYYRQSDPGHRGSAMGDYIVGPKENLVLDTNRSFNPIAPITIRNLYKTYNFTPVDILNCSENSFYTFFPKVSYDDAFEYLLTDKKFNKKSDLRIPKVSVISVHSKTDKCLRETIENVSNQSYLNREHVVVYEKAGDETRDTMRQFPDVIWILEERTEYLQMFKKGISIARGEYIFYCRIGDGYSDQDWFNTCLEVLENNPDISLVWGFPQNVSKDSADVLDNPLTQGKNFIYHWLKKKILFPQENFCVRKKTLEECFMSDDSEAGAEDKAWISFSYRFNTSGYLPYFVPMVTHLSIKEDEVEEAKDSPDRKTTNLLEEYYDDIEKYKKNLIWRKTVHHFRNGSGELIPDRFSVITLFFIDLVRYIKAKLRLSKQL